MKDIGSIFPLYAEDMEIVSPVSSQCNRINYSLCREALSAIAEKYSHSNKVVLLPAYTCQTVIEPFKSQGWSCIFFNITENLRIDTDDLICKYKETKAALAVVHPYMGMELCPIEIVALKTINEAGCILVEDLTQCIFTEKRPVIFKYFIGSYRKWTKVPDGGFLESQNFDGIQIPLCENNKFVQKQIDAMFLRGEYFRNNNEMTKQISIRLNKEAVANLGQSSSIFKMSDFSEKLWNSENLLENGEQRLINYKFLYKNIKQSDKYSPVCKDIAELTTPPLYFPIYVQNRLELQQLFIKDHIYAPILWPVESPEVLINKDIEKIYNTVLMIPIDQRYDEKDMERIVDLINAYA